MQQAEREPSQIRKWATWAFLTIFIIGFPLGSWYYLKKGADFRVANLDELQSKGRFVFPEDFRIQDKNLTVDSLFGKALLFGFWGSWTDNPDAENIRAQARQLQDQFGDRKDFLVLLNADPKDSEALNQLCKDQSILIPFTPTASVVQNFQGMDSEKFTTPGWALVDFKGDIRKYYQGGEFEKMILQTALILPGKRREKIDLIRNKENQ